MGNTFSCSRGCGGRSSPHLIDSFRYVARDSANSHRLGVEDAQWHPAEVKVPQVFLDLDQANRLATENLADEQCLAPEFDLAVVTDLANRIVVGVFDRRDARRVGPRRGPVHGTRRPLLQRFVRPPRVVQLDIRTPTLLSVG